MPSFKTLQIEEVAAFKTSISHAHDFGQATSLMIAFDFLPRVGSYLTSSSQLADYRLRSVRELIDLRLYFGDLIIFNKYYLCLQKKTKPPVLRLR